MSNEKNIRIVRGSARFKGSTDKDVQLQPFLASHQRTLIQGDRNLVLNLRDQFGFEREYSTTYRMYGKINLLYDNIITGFTNDSNFLPEVYFLPEFLGCPDITNPLYSGVITAGPPCTGLPPAFMFDMIPPKRYGLLGAGQYSEMSASTDNWVFYLSYIYSADTHQPMQFYTDYGIGSSGMNFRAGDGIPFEYSAITIYGNEAIRLRTPVPHGLKPGEYFEINQNPTSFGANVTIVTDVQITASVNGNPVITNQNVFKVDFLGDGFEGTEDYVINSYVIGIDSGYIPNNNPVGTLKRITNIGNSAETLSQYYVHKHKLITSKNDYDIVRGAFENGIYNRKGFVFPGKKTPDGIPKTGIIDEYPSYLWNFNSDVDVNNLFDNLNRPVSDIYLTIFPVNRNLLWHYQGTANSPAGYGWDWNFRKNGFIDPFVDNDVNSINVNQTNTNGVDPLPLSGTSVPGNIPVMYRGAFTEYNPYELKERIISELGHSLKFNKNGFYKPSYPSATYGDFIESIYKYQPHHRIPIRKFSNSISWADEMESTPQYAKYSLSEEMWRWRSVLPIEIYEENGNGVSYPFLNDAHYPFKDVNFVIEPLGPVLLSAVTSINILSDFTDVCE